MGSQLEAVAPPAWPARGGPRSSTAPPPPAGLRPGLRPACAGCPVAPGWLSCPFPCPPPPDPPTAAVLCTSGAQVCDLHPRLGAEPCGWEVSLSISPHGPELPTHSGLWLRTPTVGVVTTRRTAQVEGPDARGEHRQLEMGRTDPALGRVTRLRFGVSAPTSVRWGTESRLTG